ncbi:hypothetical protein [Nocardia noduli]|uniref:hypothetical protein n=1 Tax=Nocardia noduli TaxID=2815722 RepID=UPI001C21C91A|nr:hypothetical protein [Nocardia noduli]
MRASLALFLLNSPAPRTVVESSDDRELHRGDVSRLMWDHVVYSPRHDELAVFSDMPGHLVQKVRNFPGIRSLAKDDANNALVLQHVPTGGRLSFRYFNWRRPASRNRVFVMPLHFDYMPSTTLLDEREQTMIAAIPAIHEDAGTLLAGLTTRLWLANRSEGWAVSGLIRDTLGRDQGDQPPYLYLWGRDREWVLRWGGRNSVPAGDVARALTHPTVGIRGATTRRTADQVCVSLGQATLHLERIQPPSRWMLEPGGVA